MEVTVAEITRETVVPANPFLPLLDFFEYPWWRAGSCCPAVRAVRTFAAHFLFCFGSTMEAIVIGIIAAVIGGAIGFSFGRSGGHAQGEETGRRDGETRLRALSEAVKRGQTAEGLAPGTAEAELQAALQAGWSPREAEREAAMREAVGRVSTFLTRNVRAPLSDANAGQSNAELQERIGQALGALEDLDFFIAEVDEVRQGTDLTKLAQSVAREYAQDQAVGVRLSMGAANISAEVSPAALTDALYLILHNAGRFGNGATIDLSVAETGARSSITVRDRGPGFTEEAFSRAFDPFYSTADGGLGLGLPHARKVIEDMGGRIELRNVPDGGAEVEISFPAA